MNDSLAELVQSGAVSPDEALHRSVDRQGLTALLNEGPSGTPGVSLSPKMGSTPAAPLPHSGEKSSEGDSFEQFKRMQKGSN